MERLLKISEFSHLSGIKRKNLIYYDEIGLLTPERVADNGYRFYSHRQLETVSVIGALQELGMPLSEIKCHLDERSPAALIELFFLQRKKLEEKMQRLMRIETMIDTRLGLTRRALEIDVSALELRTCAEEHLFAGDEITCPDTDEALENEFVAFYIICDKEKITYGYPFGAIISQQNLTAGNFHLPSRYFFKIPPEEGNRPRLLKPAGLYLTGFGRSTHDGPQKLYTRLFAFIKEKGLTIAGNSYEELLLDEIAAKDPDEHLLQVSIAVEEPEAGHGESKKIKNM